MPRRWICVETESRKEEVKLIEIFDKKPSSGLLPKLQSIIFLSNPKYFVNAAGLVISSKTNDQNHRYEKNTSLLGLKR